MIKRKTQDKRWKVCMACIAQFPDKYGQNYTYDKARKNYAKKCSNFVKYLNKKKQDKKPWNKPCRGSFSRCKYKFELEILGQGK